MDHANNSRGRGRKTAQYYQPPRKPDNNSDGAAQSAKFERNITGPENNRVPNEKQDYNDSHSNRMKKPEQAFYTAKHQADGYQHNNNYSIHRDLRHTSEPRAVVPGNVKQNYYNPIGKWKNATMTEIE